MALGTVELVCTVGLIVPAALHWQPPLKVLAAIVLALESLVFVGVHVRYREIPPIIMSGVLGLLGVRRVRPDVPEAHHLTGDLPQ
jgi:hypothetical protein